MWPSGQGDDKQRFLADLRALRDGAAMGYDELAARTHYPDDVLKEAESGPSLPGLPVLAAFVRACDGDVPEWEERWRRLGFDADADPGLPVRPAGASPAAVAGARASVSVALPDAYDPDRIRAVLRGIHQTEQETGATAVASRPQEFAGGWGSGPSQDAGWGSGPTTAPAQPAAAEDTVRLQSGWESGYQADNRAGVSYQAEEQTVFLPDGRAGYQAEDQKTFLPDSRAGYQPDERPIFQPEERAAWQPDERSAFRAEERAGSEVDEPAAVQPGEPSGLRAGEPSGFQAGEPDLGGASAGGSAWRGEPAGLPAANSQDEIHAEAIRRDPFSSEWLQDNDLAARPGAEGWPGRPEAEPSADSWFTRPGANPREVSHTSAEGAATESWFAPRDLSGSGPPSQAGPEAGPAPSFAPDERGGTSFRPAADEPTIPRTSLTGGAKTSPASSSSAGVRPAGALPSGAGASPAGTSPAWAGQPGPAGADIPGTAVRPEPVSGPEVARTPPSAATGPGGPGEPARVRRSDRLSLVWLLVIIVVAALIGSALVLLFR